MLSKKYLFIKKILTGVSHIDIAHKKLIVLAKMYLDINKGYRFSYLADENGETELLNQLARHYRNSFTFFDVGAHVGGYTEELIKRFKTYKGHLFDLSPATLDLCREQHESNPNLKINAVALNDSVGEVEYRFYPGTLMQSGISGVGPYVGHEYELRTSPSLTGDLYCEQNSVEKINLLKIDTEGYDLHVLKGFDKMLSNQKVDVVQFEYNIKSGETHSMLGDFYTYFESKGYSVGVLRQNGVVFRPFNYTHNDFNLGPNYIACRPELKTMLATFTTEKKAA